MNRETYLKELERYLKRLPRDDYENAMEYFTEYFDEAGPEHEAEVIEDLGTPREAASELLKELLNPIADKEASDNKAFYKDASHTDIDLSGTILTEQTKTGDNQMNSLQNRPALPEERKRRRSESDNPEKPSSVGRILLIALLAIFAAPIGLPLGICAVVLLFCGVLLLALAVLCVLLVGLSGIITGFGMFIQGFSLAASSLGAMLLTLGCGLLGIGLGLLIVLFAIWAGRQMTFGLARLIGRMIDKKSQ